MVQGGLKSVVYWFLSSECMSALKQELLMVLVGPPLHDGVTSRNLVKQCRTDDCKNFPNWNYPFLFLDLSPLNFMLKCNCHCK